MIQAQTSVRLDWINGQLGMGTRTGRCRLIARERESLVNDRKSRVVHEKLHTMAIINDLNHLALGLESFEHWGDRNALEWFFALPTAIRHMIGRLYADAEHHSNETSSGHAVKCLSDFRSKEEAISCLGH